MALSRIKNWINEILTADDLNAEFNNILNNPVSLVSPVTAAFDFDGQTITLDAAAATQLVSSAAVSFNFTSGAKAGTPATTGSIANWSSQTFTDSVTAGSGTATAFVAHGIQRPTLAATNANVVTTDAATWYISNAPAAGTNETITNPWAIWVDAGDCRFDGDIRVATAGTNTASVVTVGGIQTLTGKTLTSATLDDNSNIVGSADATKKLRFEVDGITTGTTRVITPPDENFTMVGVATAQTLTNKTLTTPVINSATGIWQALVKRKTADETVANSTTLQDDDHLVFAIGANEEWVARYYVSFGTSTSLFGFKAQVTVPAGATMWRTMAFSAGQDNTFVEDGTGGSSSVTTAMAFGSSGVLICDLWVLNGATPGNVTLMWAQDTADAATLTVHKGSNLVAHRVA